MLLAATQSHWYRSCAMQVRGMIEVRMSIRRFAQSPMMRVGYAAVLVLRVAAVLVEG
jgi:hypothetical protein